MMNKYFTVTVQTSRTNDLISYRTLSLVLDRFDSEN